eukprot:jgi/Mesvir1/25702/Mv01896-RA.1
MPAGGESGDYTGSLAHLISATPPAWHSAHGPAAWVSNQEELRAAVADATIGTICINSSFTLTGGELLASRSVNVTGCCNNATVDGPAASCTLTIDGDGKATSALVVEATGAAPGPIVVHIEGINFVAARVKGMRGKGALQCSGVHGSWVHLRNVLFGDFYASHGALSIAGEGCAVTCTDCGFTNNEAVADGGAAYLQFGSLACNGCSFYNNSANRGGAIFVTTGGNVTLQRPAFSGNVAAIGGPDVFIEEAPFAALTYCPPSTILVATGSPTLPVGSDACKSQPADDDSVPDGADLSTMSREVSTSVLPESLAATWSMSSAEGLPDSAEGSPPGPSSLQLYTPSGVSQVFAGHPVHLRAFLALSAQQVDDVVLDLTLGQQKGQEEGCFGPGNVGCSGYRFDFAKPVQGSCFIILSASADQAGGCSATCRLGRVQQVNPIFLDLTLRALAVGCQLDLVATISSLGQGAMPLPVQVMQASGAPSEPIHALDARQPVIAPTSGAVGSLRQLVGHEGATAFVGTANLLSFSVIGPGLMRCDLNNSILVDGPGQVVNMTMGKEGGSLLVFQVATTPYSAVSLQVAPSACVDADGLPSMASEPFPVLIDYARPSVAAASIRGSGTEHSHAVFRIQFSEWVSGFSTGGIDITGGRLICLATVNETAGTYEAVVRPLQGVSFISFSVREGAAVDIAGNPSTASPEVQQENYNRRVLLTKTLSILFQLILGFTMLVTAMKKGPSQGRLVAFVGRLQFFQMISFLDIPLDHTLGDILHDLAWVNNGWATPIFGVGGRVRVSWADGHAPRDFAFASNGSCLGQAANAMLAGMNDTSGTRTLAEAVEGPWPRMALAELNALLRDAHPRVLEVAAPEDAVFHLNLKGDFWAIVLYSLCELLACVVVRLLCTVLWRLMYRFRPGPFWKAAPAILLFPRLELLVLMLTFPTMTQACMFYATSGFEWGGLIGACVGICYPVAFVIFAFYFVVEKILVHEECSFRAERIYLINTAADTGRRRASLFEPETNEPGGSSNQGVSNGNSLGIPANYKEPLVLDPLWVDRGLAPGRNYVLQYGLLFQDLKGPTSFDTGVPITDVSLDPAERPRSSSQSSNSQGRSFSMDLQVYLQKQEERLREWTPEPSQRRVYLPSKLLAGTGVTQGHLSAAYALVMIFKQFVFAALTGISYRNLRLSYLGAFQVGFMAVWLVFQVVYLILVQPYVSRLSQAAEVLAMLCELSTFMCCLALVIIDEETSVGLQGTFSSIILLFLFLATMASLVQLWWPVPQMLRDFYHTARDKLPRWLQGTAASKASPSPLLPDRSPSMIMVYPSARLRRNTRAGGVEVRTPGGGRKGSTSGEGSAGRRGRSARKDKPPTSVSEARPTSGAPEAENARGGTEWFRSWRHSSKEVRRGEGRSKTWAGSDCDGEKASSREGGSRRLYKAPAPWGGGRWNPGSQDSDLENPVLLAPVIRSPHLSCSTGQPVARDGPGMALGRPVAANALDATALGKELSTSILQGDDRAGSRSRLLRSSYDRSQSSLDRGTPRSRKSNARGTPRSPNKRDRGVPSSPNSCDEDTGTLHSWNISPGASPRRRRAMSHSTSLDLPARGIWEAAFKASHPTSPLSHGMASPLSSGGWDAPDSPGGLSPTGDLYPTANSMLLSHEDLSTPSDASTLMHAGEGLGPRLRGGVVRGAGSMGLRETGTSVPATSSPVPLDSHTNAIAGGHRLDLAHAHGKGDHGRPSTVATAAGDVAPGMWERMAALFERNPSTPGKTRGRGFPWEETGARMHRVPSSSDCESLMGAPDQPPTASSASDGEVSSHRPLSRGSRSPAPVEPSKHGGCGQDQGGRSVSIVVHSAQDMDADSRHLVPRRGEDSAAASGRQEGSSATRVASGHREGGPSRPGSVREEAPHGTHEGSETGGRWSAATEAVGNPKDGNSWEGSPGPATSHQTSPRIATENSAALATRWQMPWAQPEGPSLVDTSMFVMAVSRDAPGVAPAESSLPFLSRAPSATAMVLNRASSAGSQDDGSPLPLDERETGRPPLIQLVDLGHVQTAAPTPSRRGSTVALGLRGGQAGMYNDFYDSTDLSGAPVTTWGARDAHAGSSSQGRAHELMPNSNMGAHSGSSNSAARAYDTHSGPSPTAAHSLILEGASDKMTIIRRCSTSQRAHLLPPSASDDPPGSSTLKEVDLADAIAAALDDDASSFGVSAGERGGTGGVLGVGIPRLVLPEEGRGRAQPMTPRHRSHGALSAPWLAEGSSGTSEPSLLGKAGPSRPAYPRSSASYCLNAGDAALGKPREAGGHVSSKPREAGASPGPHADAPLVPLTKWGWTT